MVKKRKVIIKKSFDIQGREIANYIRKNSQQNAQKLINQVDITTGVIEDSPKAFPPEPYLETKSNLYRFALVMKSWKIIYKITNELLIFLGIIHTARHPNEIKKLRTNNYKEFI